MEESSSEVVVKIEDTDEVFLIQQPEITLQRSASDATLPDTIAKIWQSKEYSDVEIICGIDNEIVLSHKIILAAISPYLHQVLNEDPECCPHEKTTIFLPDVDSVILSCFLGKVCLGISEAVHIDSSLGFLKFECRPLDHFSKGVETQPEPLKPKSAKIPMKTPSALKRKRISEENVSIVDDGINQWFSIIDRTKAKCKSCDNLVQNIQGTTAGLRRHMKSVHPDINLARVSSVTIDEAEDNDQEAKKSKSDETTSEPDISPKVPKAKTKSKTKKSITNIPLRFYPEIMLETPTEEDPALSKIVGANKSRAWKFFQKVDGKTAVCMICRQTVSTVLGTTSGMCRHMKRFHVDAWEKNVIVEMETMENAAVSNDKLALAWNYFVRKTKNQAECSLCKILIETPKVDGSDICQHLEENHDHIWASIAESVVKTETTSEADKAAEAGEGKAKGQRSLIWNYFIRGNKEISMCRLCDHPLRIHGGTTSGMSRHLKRAHPDEYYAFKVESDRVAQLKSAAVAADDNALPISAELRKYFEEIELKDKTQVPEYMFVSCKLCEVAILFTKGQSDQLKDHMEQAHQTVLLEDSTPKPKRSAIWNFFTKTSESKRNSCNTCGKNLLCSKQNTTCMIRHLKRAHEDLYLKFLEDSKTQAEATKQAIEEVQKSKVKKKSDSNDPSQRTCPDCNKVFWHKKAMLVHQKTVHSGERPYICFECGASFARLDSFKMHTHNPERTFMCSLCGKTFSRKRARDRHEKAHTGERRYSCTQCGKAFMSNQALGRHELIHTGEKPFQCTECKKQFSQRHQMVSHMRLHTGEAPYTCEACGEKFRHLSTKQKHKCPRKSIAIEWIDTDEVGARVTIVDEESRMASLILAQRFRRY